jgi:hypothetical protein
VILVGGPLPRALDQGSGREADLAGLGVDLLDDHPHLLPLLEHVGGIGDAFPRELAHVDEPLDTVADVDERAEVADAPHDPLELVAGLERLEHLDLGLGGLLLDHGPPRKHEPPRGRHDLRDQALERLPHQLLEILDSPGAHQARRHEAPQPGHLAFETTLVGRGHAGLDHHARLELRPVLHGHGPVGGGHVVEAVGLVAAADTHRDRLPGLGQILAAIEEPGEFHRPLPAAAQIDEGRVGTDREHHARDPGARVERSLGLDRRLGLEHVVDRQVTDRRLEVGLEILIEPGPQVGHGNPLAGREHVGG